MAEQDTIFNQVLNSIRTNSVTIGQLTEVSSLSGTDYFEISGGRKVSYATLVDLFNSIANNKLNSVETEIQKKTLKSFSISATEDTATITIESYDKIFTATIPIVTDSASGFITPAMKAKIDEGYSNAAEALRKASGFETSISDLTTALNDKVDKSTKVNGHTLSGDVTITAADVGLGNAKSDITALQTGLGNAVSNITALQSGLNSKVDKTTKVNGHELSGDVTLTAADIDLGDVESDIEELQKAVWPFEMDLRVVGESVKAWTGNPNEPIMFPVTWTVTRKGKPVIDATTKLSLNGSETGTEYTGASFSVDNIRGVSEGPITITATATWKPSPEANELTAQRSVTVRIVRPMYFGFSEETSFVDSVMIRNLCRSTFVKESSAGDYRVENNGTLYSYLWLCVPEWMEDINMVTSSGFEVPMEAPIVVDGYKCYRSSNAIVAEDMKIKVSS